MTGQSKQRRVVTRETLEPPAASPLERRLRDLSSPSSTAKKQFRTEAVPPSALLSRLQTFLPQLACANDDLERRMQDAQPQAFDIEHLTNGEDAPHISFDLMCGVLDLNNDAAVAAAEAAAAGVPTAAGLTIDGTCAMSSGSESDSSDSDSDCDAPSCDDRLADPQNHGGGCDITAADGCNATAGGGCDDAAAAKSNAGNADSRQNASGEAHSVSGKAERRRAGKRKQVLIEQLSASGGG